MSNFLLFDYHCNSIMDFSQELKMGSWPYYSEDQITAVSEVLRSGKVNYWTGEEGRQFETEFANFCNCKFAIALANGTVALELALRSLDIGPGDEVIVTPRTFIASASSVVSCGAIPVFADVAEDSQNITAQTIQAVLNSRTKAIITVHLAGWPCDMDPILQLAAANNLKVIEDCAQAHGALYKGRPVGSLGDVAAFSFCQDKIISTGGEGGMLVTNNQQVWDKAWSYKDHGKSYDVVYNRKHLSGFRWLHHSFGTNFRMTEMQAVIGRLQLKKLPEWHLRRIHNADILTEHLQSLVALRVSSPPGYIEHAYYKYDAFVLPEALKDGWSRVRLMDEINAQGVPCFTGPCSEVYLEEAFNQEIFKPVNRLPMAKKLGETGLTFLVHPTLSDNEMERSAKVIESVIQNAVKLKSA